MSDNEIKLPEGLDVETARDVLREFARTEEAQIVAEETLQSLREEISEAKEAFAAVLAEESPQSAETLARQDIDALTEPFRDDEGEIDVDTLRQEPETGDADGGDGGDGEADDFDPDALGLSTREELETLAQKRTKFQNMGIEGHVEDIEAEMVDLAGAPDYETLETEVL
jgi:hypothetical protein